MLEWRRELLTERIRDLNGVKFTLKGNSYCNYGAPNPCVEQMIKQAIHHIEGDEPSISASAGASAPRPRRSRLSES